MKNITVTVDDELYRAARIRAAEQNTTVTAVVRQALEQFAALDSEFERKKRLQDEAIARLRGQGFTASDRLSREELYDRSARRKEFNARTKVR